MSRLVGSTCRICAGDCVFVFGLRGFADNAIAYHECSGCGTLQVPFFPWLEDAYCSAVPWRDDPGSKTRSKVLAKIVGSLCRGESVLDYGAGMGFLRTELTWKRVVEVDRDIGDDWRKCGPYDAAVLAEVVEHMHDPVSVLYSIARRMRSDQSAVIITTCLWRRQGPTWPYLHPELGQHITMLSQEGLETLLGRVGLAYSGSFRSDQLRELEVHVAARERIEIGSIEGFS